MSKLKNQEAEEAIEETRDGFGGSPLHSDMDLSFNLPPSPQSCDICLSPLWNFDENYVTQSDFTGTTCALSIMVFPRSFSCDSGSYESPGNSSDKKGPSSPLYSLKCRIFQAFKHLKESIKQHVLAQVWIPVKRENRYLLTTSGTPFLLDSQSYGLLQYRMASLMYFFSADGENNELGLPGRVFRNKLPEWTPNVQYYSSKEYPLLNQALHYNIRGTLALPLLEPGGCCIGVLELIMTSIRINYAPEIDLLCMVLEAVGLRRSEIFHLPSTRVLNENQLNALSEIKEVLSVVSETFRLPLAQTWTPCHHCHVLRRGGLLHPCNSYNGSNTKNVCLSTCDIAFYVVDCHMFGFREACNEHHLLEGQGGVGRAFSSLNLCFCRDITQFSKADYPLAHYARMFGLQSCLAVPVCNPIAANDIYIVEFFLPPYLTDCASQNKLLAPLSETIRLCFQNLQIASHKEFRQERDIEIISFSSEQLVPGPEHYSSQNTRASEYDHEYKQALETFRSTSIPEASQTGKEMVRTNSPELQMPEGDVIHSERKTNKGQGNVSVTVPGKEDKWTLEVLQQLYGRRLQDAAECLGVSRSTIKRICRKLGIQRWPSHKRKRTNTFSLLNKSGTSTSAFRQKFLNCTQPEILVGRFQTNKSSTAEKDLQPWGVHKQILDSCRPVPSFNLELHQDKAVANVAKSTKTATDAAGPSKRTLSINARYQQNTTKFLLPFPRTKTELEKELAETLKLMLGTFIVKYLDTENDWILMACDDDLQDLAHVSRSKCDGTIQVIVQDISNL